MWRIEYDKSVRNYIYDSYPYTDHIWRTIKSLRDSTDGLPIDDVEEIEPEIYLWMVDEHLVIYRRNPIEHKLRFLVLKPNE